VILSVVMSSLLVVLAAVVAVRAGARARGTRTEDRISDLGHRYQLPERLHAPLAAACLRAGYTGTPERWVARTALVTGGIVVLGAAASPLLAGMAAAVVPSVCAARLVQQGRGQEDRADRAVCGALETIAAEMRSGASVVEGLRACRDEHSTPNDALAHVVGRIDLGAAVPEAVQAWPEMHPSDAVRAASAAITIAYERGGRLAPALEQLAATVRDRIAARADVRAQSLQMRLSALVVATAPVAYLAFTLTVDAHNAALLVTTNYGRLCLGVGLALDGIAWWWINRVVSVPA
jgi:tight adherence protein B